MSDVARATGYDRRQIWQFENGIGLTLTNFFKLYRYYGKPIEFYLQK